MKGLMHVADEVQQELQRDEPLLGISRRVGQLGRELIDLIDNARLSRTARGQYVCGQRRMPVAGLIEVRAVQLDVDEVPLSRPLVALPGAVAIGVSIPVSPGRCGGDIVRREVVVIGGEHRDDPGACRRFEVLLGDKRDDLMTFVAPSRSLPREKR